MHFTGSFTPPHMLPRSTTPPRLPQVVLIILLASCLAACKNATSSPTPVATPAPSLISSATPPLPTLTPTITPTPEPGLAVLLAPAGADPVLVAAFEQGLGATIQPAGLIWQVLSGLDPGTLPGNLRLVVALPPAAGLADLAVAAPGVQFLAVGLPDLAPGPNLSLIGSEVERPDQQGFIAGALAALITPEWRVGVINLSDSVSSKSVRSGFLNGVVYYCGLCRPAYPPFVAYPLYIELPASASPAEWQSAADILIAQQVETVFITPGAGGSDLSAYLAQAGVNLIGAALPGEALRPHWVASLRVDWLAPAQALLPDLLAGKGSASLPAPLEILDVNPDLLSPGRLELARKILADLLAGYIDPGVDLVTGEKR